MKRYVNVNYPSVLVEPSFFYDLYARRILSGSISPETKSFAEFVEDYCIFEDESLIPISEAVFVLSVANADGEYKLCSVHRTYDGARDEVEMCTTDVKWINEARAVDDVKTKYLIQVRRLED
jgi:hypothetical protein